jgi:maleylacetoacetate isomerase
MEYLEETRPQPPLLPRDARGRARVRGLSQIAVSDGHPLIVPRIRVFLEKEMKLDEAARNLWLTHWTTKALEALESHLANERETGRFCHGDAPTIADICLASQVIGAVSYLNCDTSAMPTAMRIYGDCMKIGAFERSHPLKQAGAAVNTAH